MRADSANGRRLQHVEDAFRTLPERYLGAPAGFDATYHVRLGDVGQTWELRCTSHGARVRKGVSRRPPDVVIGTDAATWTALRDGRLSGIEAFWQRLLYARGDLDLAVGFEGLFRLPNGRPPLLGIHEVRLPGRSVSTLTMGEGPDVVCIHGLGATKVSFFDTAAALTHAGYRVHALDLPGFGSSSKPLAGLYTARWFADTVAGVMDALDVRLGHARIARQFWSLFADPDQVDPSVADVAVDEFERVYASAGARLAFLTCARNIYLDRPFGRGGFYPRLSELEAPALFVWGSHDRLIPPGFQRHVARWLPSAEQIVLEGCGHVPQVERPDQTIGLIGRFFTQLRAIGSRRSAA